MEWIGIACAVLLWMIVSRVQDSLTCLKEISMRLESNRLAIEALHQTVAYQGEEIQKKISDIGEVADSYNHEILRPLAKAGRY